GQDTFDVVYGQVDDLGGSATIGVQEGPGSRITLYGCDAPGAVHANMRITFRPYDCGEATFTPQPTRTATSTAVVNTNTYMRSGPPESIPDGGTLTST